VILLTGATGYVGGHLVPALEQRSEGLRCLTRRPGSLEGKVAARTEVARGDVADRESLAAALDGVRAAFYLVHSLDSEGGFSDRELHAAETFAAAARDAGVERIVYLGGLASDGDDLSDHLASRQAVGRVLRESGVPTIEFRASIVIGEGSASYELLRTVVEHLPAGVLPGWTRSLTQPIAIADVVSYLVAALDVEPAESAVVEIGGPERLRYVDLMSRFAEQQGLTRLYLASPVQDPPGAQTALGLLQSVVPERARVWLRLVDSMRNDSVVTDDSAAGFGIEPLGVDAALDAAA